MSSWNDDRLEELNRRVDEGFVRVDNRFTRLVGEMKEGFAELRAEMGHLGDRFDRLLNTLVLIAWTFVGTLGAALAAVLVAALA